MPENTLPSYDLSTKRGIVFKTPRYDTNALEFLKNDARNFKKSSRQVQKV
jgi:hypothetical protein